MLVRLLRSYRRMREWVDYEKGSQTSWIVFQSEIEETKTFFKAYLRSFRFCKEIPKLDCK